jgi:hypothetical protein
MSLRKEEDKNVDNDDLNPEPHRKLAESNRILHQNNQIIKELLLGNSNFNLFLTLCIDNNAKKEQLKKIEQWYFYTLQ